MFLTSVLFKYNYYSTANIVVNQGGTSSGKTFAIQQVLFCLACKKENQVITVVGQDIPNLKSGAIRDAQNIFLSSPALQAMVKGYSKTDRIFNFHNGSAIEYKSYGDAQDSKSGKRDYLFINEANGVKWEIYAELALRTRRRVFIDFNPNTAFWVHENLIGKPGVQLIISDYRHNPFLDENQQKKIEALKYEDSERWRVYARGLTGKIKGLILDNWHICEQIPKDAKLLAVGLDFGFTNDQTGVILVYRQNGELWADELLYETGLTNSDISLKLARALISKNTEIIADSAEPKSIEELRRLGWNITGAKKGADRSQVFSMATGPQGPQGTAGTNGSNGTNGNTILFGATNPSNSTIGIDGNFYINTSSYFIFGPKTAGVWDAGISIIGTGIPTGGTAGQILTKADGTDFNTEWEDNSFANLSGLPGDNTDLAAALAAKQDGLGFTPENTADKNQPNGYTGLDSSGKVAVAQLPSYVDDVLEFVNFAALPSPGETGKIYVTLDTNAQYRWSGSVYIQLVGSPGSTDAVPEGTTNLYFTVARVLAAALSGISFGAISAVTATDSILVAMGKLQAQITSLSAKALPAGGTAGQLLAKNSTTDYDTGWVNAPSGGGSSNFSYNFYQSVL